LFRSKRSLASFATAATVAVGVFTSLLASQTAAHAQNFVLYGATTGGAIYEVDPEAKTSVQVANFGSNINGLAWDPTTERLYFARTLTTNNGDGGLYYWDRATNTFSGELLSATSLLGAMDNGSYYNGAIWYVDGNGETDTMYRLSLSDYSITSFADFDGTARTYYDFGDLVITNSGQMFGFASRNQAQATFFEIDISSGAPLSSSYSEVDVAGNYQLGINLDDSVMYGTTGINLGSGNWFTVATNGATVDGLTLTSIDNFTTPSFTDLSGRAAIPVNASATAPEPGSLALLLPLLGTVGMVIRRRKK
jgi:hypothetical protein